MHVGICSQSFINHMSLEQFICWAGEGGFDCVEIAVRTPRVKRGSMLGLLDPFEMDTHQIDDLKRLLEREKIFISSLFYYGANILSEESGESQENSSGLTKSISIAKELGASAVVISTGVPYQKPRMTINPWGIYYHGFRLEAGEASKAEALRIYKNRFKPIVETAEEKNIKLAFEPSSLGAGSGSVAYSPEMLDLVFEQIPSKHVGLCFDPSHFIWMQIDYMKYLKSFLTANKVFVVHCKDTIIDKERLGYSGVLGDSWWKFCLPGWGMVDWRGVLRQLKEGGYDFALNIEHEDGDLGFRLDWLTGKRVIDLDLVKESSLASKVFIELTRRSVMRS